MFRLLCVSVRDSLAHLPLLLSASLNPTLTCLQARVKELTREIRHLQRHLQKREADVLNLTQVFFFDGDPSIIGSDFFFYCLRSSRITHADASRRS